MLRQRSGLVNAHLLDEETLYDIAWVQLMEELGALYVPGMSWAEYAAEERWYWDNQRRMMQQFLGPVQVQQEIMDARTDIRVQAYLLHHARDQGIEEVPDVPDILDYSAPGFEAH